MVSLFHSPSACTSLCSRDHSRRPIPEFSRPGEVVADVKTKEMRPSIFTTNTIDKEWGLLKAPLPDNLEAKTPAQIERVDMLVRAQQFRRMVSIGDRWSAFLKGAQRWTVSKQKGTVAAQGKLGDFAQRLAVKRSVAARSADDTIGTGQVPLKDSEKAALEAALGKNEIQGKDEEAALQKLREESAATQPSLERVMEELDIAEVEKLERACKARRTAFEQQVPLPTLERELDELVNPR